MIFDVLIDNVRCHTFSILTGLMPDLKALTNLSHIYRSTGMAMYIHVCVFTIKSQPWHYKSYINSSK